MIHVNQLRAIMHVLSTGGLYKTLYRKTSFRVQNGALGFEKACYKSECLTSSLHLKIRLLGTYYKLSIVK